MKITIQRNRSEVAALTLKNLGGGDYELEYLKVEPAHRQSGLASSLLNKAIALAQKRQWNLVALPDPDGTGLTSQRIYEWLKRKGFKSIRYTFYHGWKHGNGYTKWVMFKEPNTSPP